MADVTVKDIFKEMPNRFNADAAKGMDAVIQFNLTGDDGGQYYADHQGREARSKGRNASIAEDDDDDGWQGLRRPHTRQAQWPDGVHAGQAEDRRRHGLGNEDANLFKSA